MVSASSATARSLAAGGFAVSDARAAASIDPARRYAMI